MIQEEFKQSGNEFIPFPKIKRLKRGIVITEKIDGTNAQIFINDEGEIRVGSRNRYITPEKDNYGFATWVQNNEEELLKLGPGRHFGEWYGNGIGRNYGLKEKRLALFNTSRWANSEERPKCCECVPILYVGEFNTENIDSTISYLKEKGSFIVPRFMNPEGIVVYHSQSNMLFKVTLEGDEHKGEE